MSCELFVNTQVPTKGKGSNLNDGASVTVLGVKDGGAQARPESTRAQLAHELMLWRYTFGKDDTHAYVADSHRWAPNTATLVYKLLA